MTDSLDSYGFIDDQDADDAKVTGIDMPYDQKAELGKVPEYINEGIDLVSGKPMEVLEKGSCSENMLGDTAPQPVTFEIVNVAEMANKNNVGE